MTAVLTRRYDQRLTDLRTRVNAVAADQWKRLGSYDEADIPRWVEAITPLTAASRAAAATLTAGYLHAAHNTNQPVTADQLRDLNPELWRQPFMSMWASLARSEGFDAALTLGTSRAGDTSAEIVTITARDAAGVVDSSSPQLTRWVRVPAGPCCDWCADMATLDFGSAEEAALGDQHSNCNCAVVPA